MCLLSLNSFADDKFMLTARLMRMPSCKSESSTNFFFSHLKSHGRILEWPSFPQYRCPSGVPFHSAKHIIVSVVKFDLSLLPLVFASLLHATPLTHLRLLSTRDSHTLSFSVAHTTAIVESETHAFAALGTRAACCAPNTRRCLVFDCAPV